MSRRQKGLLLAAVQLAIVLSLSVKLLYDRATRPRVWVLCETYDPELPLRGRYLAERLRMASDGFASDQNMARRPNMWWENRRWAYLRVEKGQLIASASGTGNGEWVQLRETRGALLATTEEPVLLFIPENAQIPSLARGEEMWVEVTVPEKGPPRPIRIGIKRNGILTPLSFN